MVANGILGLENHDEELKEIFGCKYNFAEKISYLKKRWGAEKDSFAFLETLQSE